MCSDCADSLQKSKPDMHPVALSNDMMICYAPDELYTKQATIMEVIFASVRVTSMECFAKNSVVCNCSDSFRCFLLRDLL